MNKISTPISKHKSTNSSKEIGPRRSTLDFIKGFARSYASIDQFRRQGLGDLILN
ncbi:MAG: hypothetical protein J6R27_00475 [Muribaculaceae bacterium]|nr:hypothetical protein [Muribaculaceae bacterium]